MSEPTANSNEPAPAKEQDLRWDEHYDNPRSEIVLISEDRVAFRVDA